MEKNSAYLTPLVSICIPCFNAGKYVEETIKSILNQSHSKLEVIVIDDHSKDDSTVILDKLQQSDSRISWQRALRQGAAAARNQAYSLSKGAYIVFFDADDLIEPNFIESQLKCIYPGEEDCVVSSWGRFVGKVDNFIKDELIVRKDLSFEDWIIKYWTTNDQMTPPGRTMIPRKLLEKSGLWDESLSLNDDFQFYTQLFNTTAIIKYNNDADFKYRSMIGGLSSEIYAHDRQESNLKSLLSGIRLATARYQSIHVKKACANLLQNLIYDCYPQNMDLIRKAESEIQKLGGSDLPFPSGGLSKILKRAIGWKLTKRIKMLITK